MMAEHDNDPIGAAADAEPIPEGLVEALADPTAYLGEPDAPSAIEAKQTHISHLFLTADRVYKLRKAVRPGFLDFGTREARNADCLREVALNRRLAPDVYLGVAALRLGSHGAEIGRIGETIAAPELEHCVVMRRLSETGNAQHLLEGGLLSADHIDATARVIARFHERQSLGRPVPGSAGDWLPSIAEPVEAVLAALLEVGDGGRVRELAVKMREFLATHPDRFELRRRDGRAVDGHGDLHLDHVWFENGSLDPLFIDCIEFSDTLRRIDRASEVAFLTMDLIYRGARDLADLFLRRYARESDDFGLYSVVDYYLGHRAAVRAMVAGMATRDAGLSQDQRRAAGESAERHLDLALQALPGHITGALVMISGVVGTGKSTAAEVVAAASGGVVAASDRVRKKLLGLDPTHAIQAEVDQGLYAEEHRERVYEGLLQRACAVVSSGRVVILDATHSRRAQREQAAHFAQCRNLPILQVETRCSAEEAKRRLAERQREGRDPSDAGPSFYRESVARFEPVAKSESGLHVVVSTDAAGWRDDLARRVVAWRAESG